VTTLNLKSNIKSLKFVLNLTHLCLLIFNNIENNVIHVQSVRDHRHLLQFLISYSELNCVLISCAFAVRAVRQEKYTCDFPRFVYFSNQIAVFQIKSLHIKSNCQNGSNNDAHHWFRVDKVRQSCARRGRESATVLISPQGVFDDLHIGSLSFMLRWGWLQRCRTAASSASVDVSRTQRAAP